MANEIAVAAPFESSEIIEIAVNQFRKKLQGLSPLQGEKQYSAFQISYAHTITLTTWALGQRETLAWGEVKDGTPDPDGETITAKDTSKYANDLDVNAEREANDLPLHVQTTDVKGNTVTKKVRVKGGK